MDDGSTPRTAPFHSIPPRRLVSVEHPAVIQDVDKAIDTLQGNAGVSKVSLYPILLGRKLTDADSKSSQG